MTVIGILFEKRIVDDSGFPRTPDRPVELLGTRVRYPRSVKTTIGACGPDSLGGSATIATSCDDLIVESIDQGSSSKGKKVVESDNYDDYVKLKNENEKLKKDLEDASTINTIVIENLDNGNELALDNEKLREENKRLKMEKIMMNLKKRTRSSSWRKNISRPV